MNAKTIVKALMKRMRITTLFVIKSLFVQGFSATIKYKKERKKPILEKTVLFEAFRGNKIADTPYALFLELINNDDYKDYQFIWTICDKSNYLIKKYAGYSNVKFCDRQSSLYVKALARSKYLINNNAYPAYFVKRDEQIYVSSWHATALKALGKHQGGTIGQFKNLTRNFMQVDYLVMPNRFTSEIMLDSNDVKGIFPGYVVEEGYPRMDLTINTTRDEAVDLMIREAKIKLDRNKKIVLYAPTWRGETGNYQDNIEDVNKKIAKIKKRLGDEYEVVIKYHNLVERYMDEHKMKLSCKLIPDWIDTNIMLNIVDVIVTDYSSIFIDALVLGKPVVFYTYDLEEYIQDRGLYFDMATEMPGPLCMTSKEVVEAVKNIDELFVQYKDKYEAMKQRFCSMDDGNASKRVVDIVFKGKVTENMYKSFDEGKKRILMVSELNTGNSSSRTLVNQMMKLSNNLDYSRYDLTLLFTGDVNKSRTDLVKALHPNTRVFYSFGTDVCSFAQYYKNNTNGTKSIAKRIKDMEDYKENYALYIKGLLGEGTYDCAIVEDKFVKENVMVLLSEEIKKKIVLLEKDDVVDKRIPMSYLKEHADIIISNDKKLTKNDKDIVYNEFTECFSFSLNLAKNRLTEGLKFLLNTVHLSEEKSLNKDDEERIICEYKKSLDLVENKANEMDLNCKVNQRNAEKEQINKLCDLI